MAKNGTFFEKQGTKNFTTPYSISSVLYKVTLWVIFTERETVRLPDE